VGRALDPSADTDIDFDADVDVDTDSDTDTGADARVRVGEDAARRDSAGASGGLH
jgi:hypothetical protein